MEWAGYIAAMLTTSSFIPQALRVIRTRDTKAISLSMYMMFTLGVLFWLMYGFYLGELPIIVANCITLTLSSIILFMKIRFG